MSTVSWPRLRRASRFACSALVALALLSSCTSSSIRRDETLVRGLANERRDHRLLPLLREQDLPSVAERAVQAEDEVDAQAKELLKAPLTADSATRLALLQNRALRAALRDMGVMRGQVLQAGLLPNPRVHVEVFPGEHSELKLGVELSLMRSILAPARARAVSPLLEAARFDAARALLQTGYAARVGFYALQAAEQRVALARIVQSTLRAGLEARRAMYAAGNTRDLELSSADVAAERAGITVALLELDLVAAQQSLQNLLGVELPQSAWPKDPRLEPVPQAPDLPDDAPLRALRTSLALRAMQLHLQSLERQAGFAQTEGFLPDLSVELLAAREAATGDDFHFGAGARLEVPLFDRNQGAVTSLDAQRDGLLERYYGYAIMLRAQTRRAIEGVRSSHARALKYQEVIVPGQARVVEQVMLQYNAMQIGIFELLRARREQLDVQLQYIETVREYWSSVAELQMLLAGGDAAGVRQASADAARMGQGAINASSGSQAPQEGH